jgi:CarD family transcriptional regulator
MRRGMTVAERFKIGDKVICPAHFPGVIEGIEKKVVSGQERRFYIVRILESDAKIMIPTDTLGATQPRRPISPQEVAQVYKILGSRDLVPIEGETETWNRRYRRYQLVLSTGSLLEIAGLLRALHQRKRSRGAALGEARVMERCMDLLVGEVTSAGQRGAENVRKEIVGRLEAHCKNESA